MTRFPAFVVILVFAALATAAVAQFNGCPPGFCNPLASSTPAACEGGLLNADSDCITNGGGSFIKAAP